MPAEPTMPLEAVGRLCVAGDRACVLGDPLELRCIAEQLAAYVPAALREPLAEVAIACNVDCRRAVELWDRWKRRLDRELRA